MFLYASAKIDNIFLFFIVIPRCLQRGYLLRVCEERYWVSKTKAMYCDLPCRAQEAY